MRIRFETKSWMLSFVLGVSCLALFLPLRAFSGETEPPPAPAAVEQQPQIPPIVAKVEDEVITGEEFQQAMFNAMRMKAAQSARDPNRDPNQPPEGLDRDDAERVLQSMIRAKAIYALAKKAETKVPDEEVNEAFEKAKARIPAEQFEQILKDRGMTEADFKGKLREQLVSQKFFEEKTKDVSVSEDEVKKAYEELKAAGRMEKPETANVSHILILAPKDGPEEDVAKAKKDIEAARERVVTKKEDFAEVAKEVSQDKSSAPRGGLYEDVPRGRMVPEFEQRMFELPLNEVSEPFQTQYLWHIMKVHSREAAATLTYDEVKDNVRSAVENKAKGDAFREYLTTALDSLKIEILLPKKDEAAGAAEAPGEKPKASSEETELPEEPS